MEQTVIVFQLRVLSEGYTWLDKMWSILWEQTLEANA